uniref:Uncharacterized protein n=1 Tax=Poecilia formosa TaxID=48698 RepID=A0A096M3I3_POEFO
LIFTNMSRPDDERSAFAVAWLNYSLESSLITSLFTYWFINSNNKLKWLTD